MAATFVCLSRSLTRSPVDGHGREVEDGGGDGEDGEEVVDAAVGGAKVPAVVAHVDVVEGGVEGGHAEVREAHVGDERVRDGPHVAVGCGSRSNRFKYNIVSFKYSRDI